MQERVRLACYICGVCDMHLQGGRKQAVGHQGQAMLLQPVSMALHRQWHQKGFQGRSPVRLVSGSWCAYTEMSVMRAVAASQTSCDVDPLQ